MANKNIFDIENDDDNESNDSWLTTFCDISLLLLTFFILVLSMSTINKQKFRESFSAIRDTFGGDQQMHTSSELEQQLQEQALDLLRLQEEMIAAQKNTFDSVRTFITQNALEKDMQATFDDGIITLRLPSEVLFDPGSDKLNPRGIEVLKTMRDFFIKNREQSINIKGYTDDSPIPPDSRYENNWELSALRAVNVLRQLLSEGIEATRMTATGLGDLEPLAPNDTPENKAQNRRVEFTLERKVGKAENIQPTPINP